MNRKNRCAAFILGEILAGAALLSGCGGSSISTSTNGTGSTPVGGNGTPRFEILFENIATTVPIVTSTGDRQSVAFSPFVLAVHESPNPFFQLGAIAPTNGLEAFAEDAAPGDFLTSVQSESGISLIGLAATPVGETSGSLLAPGQQYKVVLQATEGDSLSFVSSYLQANDLVVSTPPAGIPFFDANGTPLKGDLTGQLSLIDIGTEQNEEPGAGPNQVLRQSGNNVGTFESKPVAQVADGFTYPPLALTLRVTVNPL